MGIKQTEIAQRSQQQHYFDHRDMDYYFSWILGRQIYGGSISEECFEAASQIVDGDPESWQRVWVNLAQQVEAQANQGDVNQARACYLRACTYYRAPLFIMNPEAAAFGVGWRRMQACFRKAAALFDPPIETIQIPFRDQQLPGYVWTVDHSSQQRPTLIVVGGLETFAEDCYFMIGQSSAQYGYNAIAVDLPGQSMNPQDGLFFEARMGTAVQAVVDYAMTRPDVDPVRLALYGFSWGGHIVFQGVQHDQRIKALIANPAMPDVFRAALAQQGRHGRGDRVGRIIFNQIAWRFGLKLNLKPRNLLRRIAKAYDYFMHGKVKLSQIQSPTLCMAGEGEPQITLDIARECHEQLPNPQKKLVIFTQAEGGEAHCQVNHLNLPNQIMFRWLDQIFNS